MFLFNLYHLQFNSFNKWYLGNSMVHWILKSDSHWTRNTTEKIKIRFLMNKKHNLQTTKHLETKFTSTGHSHQNLLLIFHTISQEPLEANENKYMWRCDFLYNSFRLLGKKKSDMSNMEVNNIFCICSLNANSKWISWMECKGNQATSWRRWTLPKNSSIDLKLQQSWITCIKSEEKKTHLSVQLFSVISCGNEIFEIYSSLALL